MAFVIVVLLAAPSVPGLVQTVDGKCSLNRPGGHPGDDGQPVPVDFDRSRCHAQRGDPPPRVNGTVVDVRIVDGYAIVYEYKEFYNPGSQMQVGQILFPVQEGGEAITDLKMIVGGVVYGSDDVSKDVGSQRFADAVANDQEASLVEWIGGNLYALKVNLPPKESRTVFVTWEMPLHLRNGYYTYTYQASLDAAQGGNYMEVNLKLSSGSPIEDLVFPNQDVTVQWDGEKHATARLPTVEALQGRDFKVSYKPMTPTTDSIVVALPTEADLDDSTETGEDPWSYFRYDLPGTAKQLAGLQTAMPVHVSILVDSSGSTSGETSVQARQVVRGLLDSMGDGATARVGVFRSAVIWYDAAPTDVSSAYATTVDGWLADQSRKGSSNWGRAIEGGVGSITTDVAASSTPYIVLISDGEATSGTTNVAELGRLAGSLTTQAKKDIKLFTVGIGGDPAGELLDEVGKRGGGGSYYANSLTATDVGSAVGGNLTAMIAYDVRIRATGPELRDVVPVGGQDLMEDGALRVVGRFRGNASLVIDVTGKDSSGEFSFTSTFDTNASTINEVLPKEWVMLQIGELLERINREGEVQQLTKQVETLGLAHGIVTPYSSKVIVVPSADKRAAGAPEDAAALAPSVGFLGAAIAFMIAYVSYANKQTRRREDGED